MTPKISDSFLPTNANNVVRHYPCIVEKGVSRSWYEPSNLVATRIYKNPACSAGFMVAK